MQTDHMSKAYSGQRAGGARLANLNRLAYFAAVVEAGSFTAAAERLGITKAVVSQQVAKLEREFGASLLIRSTRRVRLTEAGQAFYVRCASILKEAEEAFGELSDAASEPTGTLKLTAPFDYGINVVVPAIAAFSERFGQCKVEAFFSDQTLDLLASDIDLAVRVGWLTEQHLQARKISAFRQLLVAPAAWRARIERLREPREIAALPFVANRALREPARWAFAHAEHARQTVHFDASIVLDATLAVREATLGGAGL